MVNEVETINATLQLLDIYRYRLIAAPRVARDNPFRVVSLSLFTFLNWTNLIKNNVFYNHIFICYRKNHKCNI